MSWSRRSPLAVQEGKTRYPRSSRVADTQARRIASSWGQSGCHRCDVRVLRARQRFGRMVMALRSKETSSSSIPATSRNRHPVRRKVATSTCASEALSSTAAAATSWPRRIRPITTSDTPPPGPAARFEGSVASGPASRSCAIVSASSRGAADRLQSPCGLEDQRRVVDLDPASLAPCARRLLHQRGDRIVTGKDDFFLLRAAVEVREGVQVVADVRSRDAASAGS